MIAYRRMLTRMLSALALAGAFVVVSADRADAALIVYVCNDAACAAGGTFVDQTIVDNSVDDLNPADGRISLNLAGGHVDVDASSYPSAGSETSPFLALTYDLDSAGFAELDGTPYFFATQDGFTSTGTVGILANASSGGGTVDVYSDGGSFTPPGAAPIFTCALNCSGFAPTSGSVPFYLAIEVAPTAGTAGTARGDVTLESVPDGGTTATLLGSVLVVVGMLRRRFGNG